VAPDRSRAGVPSELSAADVARCTLLAGGLGLAVDAALILFEGSSAIVPSGSIAPPVVGLLAGGGIAAAAVGSARRGFPQVLRRATPEMFPFGAGRIQIGVFLLVLFASSAVSHGVVVAFSGADAGATGTSVAATATVDALLAVGSFVLWVLALYAVYGLRRFIQMGRALDARQGTDPFGGGPLDPAAVDTAWLPERSPAPPAARGAIAAAVAITTVLMLEIVTGIQLIETPIGPTPAGAFWLSQLITLGAAAVVSAVVLAIDRGVRDLERQYAAAAAPPPQGRDNAEAARAPGFVP
jgi:hypothetical protein